MTITSTSANAYSDGGLFEKVNTSYIEHQYQGSSQNGSILSLSNVTPNDVWGTFFSSANHSIYITSGNIHIVKNGTIVDTNISYTSGTFYLRLQLIGNNMTYQYSTDGSNYTLIDYIPVASGNLFIYAHITVNGNSLIGGKFIRQFATKKTRIVFIGESNSGGFADNDDAVSTELDSNSSIQIWDNTNNDGFDDLKISNPNSNNLLGHDELGVYIGLRHGWELQLQTKTATLGSPIYLVKCGQGGSIISEWATSGDYYTTFVTRDSGSKSQLSSLSTSYDTYVFISFGINDANAGTDTTVWYNSTYDWIQNVKKQTGARKIIMTNLMTNTANKIAINTEIDNLVSNLTYLYKVDASAETLEDGNHWDYQGMKDICDLLVASI